MYAALADVVLVVHFGIVAFVVGGLALVLVGNALRWHWVNRRGFRLTHLLAIAFVVAESWLGMTCPLTALEAWLRTQGGGHGVADSFVGYWVQRWLYYAAPAWVFTLAYSVFGVLVALTWWRFPPI